MSAERPAPESLLSPARLARIDGVVAQRTRSLILVLDQVGDPHNVAAVLRTCDGFGIQEVHVIAHESTGFRIDSRVTKGCEKWLDVVIQPTWSRCRRELESRGYVICASDLGEGAISIDALPFAGKLAIVLGNERDGVNPDACNQANLRFVIPMKGFSQSYNVGVSAAVVLTTAQERRRLLGFDTALPAEEAEQLRVRFRQLAVKQGVRLYGEQGGGAAPGGESGVG